MSEIGDLDRIELTGLRARGNHGVLATEREIGQDFVVDLVIYLDTRPAAKTDELAATIDYRDVVDRVTAVLTGDPVNLLETLAERIAATVLDVGARRVDVRVHKPDAPLGVDIDVAVAISRDDGDRAPAVDPPNVAVPAFAQPAESVDQDAGLTTEGAPAFHWEPEDTFVADLEVAPDPDPGAVPDPALEHATVVEPDPEPDPSWPPSPAGATRLQPSSDVDISPPSPIRAVIGLGANLGEPAATLTMAVHEIAALPTTELVGVSPLARTAAVGGPEQPDYLNAVVVVRTRLSARALLHELQRIEDEHCRVRVERWAARTLDLDLITYGTVIHSDDELTLPHPRAAERAFVLEPWSHLDPDAELPGVGRVVDLARNTSDRAGIRWMALDWLKQ